MISYADLQRMRYSLAKRFEELNMFACSDDIVNAYYACDQLLEHLLFFSRLENQTQNPISEEQFKKLAHLILSDDDKDN